jgi:hypothetical protein
MCRAISEAAEGLRTRGRTEPEQRKLEQRAVALHLLVVAFMLRGGGEGGQSNMQLQTVQTVREGPHSARARCGASQAAQAAAYLHRAARHIALKDLRSRRMRHESFVRARQVGARCGGRLLRQPSSEHACARLPVVPGRATRR